MAGDYSSRPFEATIATSVERSMTGLGPWVSPAQPTSKKEGSAMVRVRGAVDADAHVDETDATWEYMTAAESRFKPISVDPGRPTAARDTRPHRLWLIDGRIGLRRWRSDERTGTTQVTR